MSGQGTQGAMLKKKFPHADLHMNSNIIIQMDEKPRLKSHYMKKYTESVRSEKIERIQARPAGTINFRQGNIDEQKHLNHSRRRILNDFVSPQKNASALEVHANRNKSQLLKMQDAPRQDKIAQYDYPGPPAQIIGSAGRPGLIQQQANRMKAARGNGAPPQQLEQANSQYRLPQLDSYNTVNIYNTLPSVPSANRNYQHDPEATMDRKSRANASQRDLNEIQRLQEAQKATSRLINHKAQTRSVKRQVTQGDQNQFIPEDGGKMHYSTFDEQNNYSQANEYGGKIMTRQPSMDPLQMHPPTTMDTSRNNQKYDQSGFQNRSKTNALMMSQAYDNNYGASGQNMRNLAQNRQYQHQSMLSGGKTSSMPNLYSNMGPASNENQPMHRRSISPSGLDHIGSQIVQGNDINSSQQFPPLTQNLNQQQSLLSPKSLHGVLDSLGSATPEGKLSNLKLRNSYKFEGSKSPSYARPNQVSEVDLQQYRNQFRGPAHIQRQSKLLQQSGNNGLQIRKQSIEQERSSYAQMEGHQTLNPRAHQAYSQKTTPLKSRVLNQGAQMSLAAPSGPPYATSGPRQQNILRSHLTHDPVPNFNTTDAASQLQKVYI